MSLEGSKHVPNNWELEGDVDLEGQAEWYEKMFRAVGKNPWVQGLAFWSWRDTLFEKEEARGDKGYEIYGKPALRVVREKWKEFPMEG